MTAMGTIRNHVYFIIPVWWSLLYLIEHIVLLKTFITNVVFVKGRLNFVSYKKILVQSQFFFLEQKENYTSKLNL